MRLNSGRLHTAVTQAWRRPCRALRLMVLLLSGGQLACEPPKEAAGTGKVVNLREPVKPVMKVEVQAVTQQSAKPPGQAETTAGKPSAPETEAQPIAVLVGNPSTTRRPEAMDNAAALVAAMVRPADSGPDSPARPQLSRPFVQQAPPGPVEGQPLPAAPGAPGGPGGALPGDANLATFGPQGSAANPDGKSLWPHETGPQPPPKPYSPVADIAYYPKPSPHTVPEKILKAGVRFEEVAAARGIDSPARTVPKAFQNLIESSGQGLGWVDVEGDDWPDLITLSPQPRLYRNVKGQFKRDATAFPALSGTFRGIAAADIDLDGDPDLYLSGWHTGVLLENQKGRFVVSKEQLPAQTWGMSATFADLDRDGRPDLVVGNYVQYDPDTIIPCRVQGRVEDCGPHYYAPAMPRVYHNQVDGSRPVGSRLGSRLVFDDVTQAWGFTGTNGRNLGVMARDLDGDGRLEVIFANDMTPGDLMVRACPPGWQGTETEPESCQPPSSAQRAAVTGLWYENRGALSGMAYDSRGQVHAGMGIDVADQDRDGLLDMAMGAFYREGTSLYRAAARLLYRDLSWQTGLGQSTWQNVGFGLRFLDADRDGWPELFQANGHILQHAAQFLPGATYQQPLQLFYNSKGFLWDLPESRLNATPTREVYRGLAVADFDRDGRVDVAVNTLDGQLRLYHNTSTDVHQALSIRLKRKSGQDAQGTFFRVRTEDEIRVESFGADGSYLSVQEPRTLVGLGDAHRVERVDVVWDVGQTEAFGPFEVKEGTLRLDLTEGQGQKVAGAASP